MKEKLSSTDLIKILEKTAGEIESSQDYLRDLDAAIGDGDLGVTTTIGFKAVREGLANLAESDVGTILIKSGLNYLNSIGSTFGVFLATAFIEAGKEVKGKAEVGIADLDRMFRAAAEGVKERGKANLGDKTMLDVMMPVTEALERMSAEGRSMKEALDAALDVGNKALKATTKLKAKIGRASWLGDRSIGKQDPGATVIYIMLKSLVEYVKIN